MEQSLHPDDYVDERGATALARNRDYRLIVIAGVVSAMGSKVSQIALPLLALALTQSPVWAGLLGAAQQLPYLILSLPAGALVDRLPRRQLLIACDLLRCLLLGSIPVAYALGVLGMTQLLIVVFVAGSCTVLFEIADIAALPHVVGPAQLARARSVSEGVEAGAAALGPGLGGLIVALGRSTAGGAALAYLVDSLSYLLSAFALLAVRRPLHTAPSETAPIWRAVQEGLRFLWGRPALRGLMLLTAAVNFLQAPLALGVVLAAQRRFGLSPAQIGLIFSVAGAAALLGALLAARLHRPERLRPTVLGALLAWALSALLMAVAPSGVLLALAYAVTQLAWPSYAVAVVSYRLSATPEGLHGRVTSAFRTLSYGAEPLGLAVGGWAAAAHGPTAVFAAATAGLLLCAAVTARRPR
jgi:predicted MFS family arabinose efflux permease